MYGTARSFAAIYLSTLLMQVGSTLLITCLALRLNAAGAGDFQVGALMAANALGMVCGGGAGRLLIARLGHVRACVASTGVIVLAVAGHMASSALPFWLLLRAMVGAATICQLMVVESWLNERADGKQRGTVLAMYMIATYAGMMLGQLAVGADDDAGTFALPAVALAFALCLAPLALTRTPRPSTGSPAPVSMGRLIRSLPQPFLVVFVSGMLNGSYFGLSGVFAARQGMDAAAVGCYLALTVVAGLLAQLPLGLLSDRVSRVSLIRGTALLLALVSMPPGLVQGLSQATLLVFAFGIGSLQFCLYPLGAGLANERIDAGMRVPLAGMLLTVFGVGSCIGPLVAGAWMSWAGPSSLYRFVAVCAAALAVFLGHIQVHGNSRRAFLG